MASRCRTDLFCHYRRTFRTKPSEQFVEIDIETSTPEWIKVKMDIEQHLKLLDAELGTFKQLKIEASLPRFHQDGKSEALAQCEQRIKLVIRQSHHLLQQLGKYEDKIIVQNMKKAFTAHLFHSSLDFSEHVQQRAAHQQKQEHLHKSASSQQALLLLQQEETEQRMEHMEHVFDAVHELHSVFSQMHTMITEQGSLLDRIDYSIEQTHHETEKAYFEIEETNKRQKRNFGFYCILILAFIILILLLLILFK